MAEDVMDIGPSKIASRAPDPGARLPAFGALAFGALLFGDVVTFTAIAGAALVAAGIAVAQWPRRPSPARAG